MNKGQAQRQTCDAAEIRWGSPQTLACILGRGLRRESHLCRPAFTACKLPEKAAVTSLALSDQLFINTHTPTLKQSLADTLDPDPYG